MKKYVTCLLVAFWTGVTLASPSDDLKSILLKTHTYQADFTQTLVIEKSKKSQQFSGLMRLKRPNQFYWKIQKPDPTLVVSNGEMLWHFDEDLEQVTTQPLTELDPNAPVFFLTGDVHSIDVQFNVTQQGSEFRLTPISAGASFEWAALTFENERLVKFVVLDQLGQRSTFLFYNIVTNQPIDSKLFQFITPHGVDEVKANS